MAELARWVDVDAMSQHTAPWRAVTANRPDNARTLVAAGADAGAKQSTGVGEARNRIRRLAAPSATTRPSAPSNSKRAQ
jgi:hypothetical protein